MLKVYSGLARFFRTIPPLFHRYKIAAYIRSHPSCVLRHGHDKSSPLSSATSYIKSLRRCETSGNLFALGNRRTTSVSSVFHTLLRSYSCEKTADEMACPLRDPASEQLNDWKRKLKVTLLVLHYIYVVSVVLIRFP